MNWFIPFSSKLKSYSYFINIHLIPSCRVPPIRIKFSISKPRYFSKSIAYNIEYYIEYKQIDKHKWEYEMSTHKMLNEYSSYPRASNMDISFNFKTVWKVIQKRKMYWKTIRMNYDMEACPESPKLSKFLE